MRLTRHPIHLELAASGAEQRRRLLQAALEGARRDPEQLNALALTARAYAGYLSVVHPDSPDLARALRLGGEAAAAIAVLAATETATAAVDLDGAVLHLPATGPTSAAHVDNWRAGFYMACICRDGASLDLLCDTSIDVLRRSSGKIEDCQYLLANALQGLWRRDRDVQERLRVTLDAAEPTQLRAGGDELVRDQIVPEIELLSWYLLGDGERLGEAVAAALERHRAYWSAGSRRTDPDGYLALGPLAITALAHDAKMAIAVESDYMPRVLRKGK